MTQVPARGLYGVYRQRIETLANMAPRPNDIWMAELQEVLAQFKADTASLTPGRAHLLCWELCEQFEDEAYQTGRHHRRDVLMAAIKGLERIALEP